MEYKKSYFTLYFQNTNIKLNISGFRSIDQDLTGEITSSSLGLIGGGSLLPSYTTTGIYTKLKFQRLILQSRSDHKF